MMKRPDGMLVEESFASTAHMFEDGKLIAHDSDFSEYTGRFYWEHPDGKRTRWYNERSAPQWLLALYYESTKAG
jgi:hypothetical protein